MSLPQYLNYSAIRKEFIETAIMTFSAFAKTNVLLNENDRLAVFFNYVCLCDYAVKDDFTYILIKSETLVFLCFFKNAIESPSKFWCLQLHVMY